MVITLKKRTQPGWLVWLLVMMPFSLGTLNDLLGVPWAIRYLMDAAWFFSLLFLLRLSPSRRTKGTQCLAMWAGGFLGYTLLVYLVQFQSPFYYFWGVRNNFRFYAAFFAFLAFLTPDDVEGFLKIFDYLFWVNVVVSLVQYFGMGLEGDFLGGIFGTEIGGNSYTNVFFIIVVARSLLLYLEKRETAGNCVSKCAAALFVAVLAELKFFFVEFILIIVLAVLFTNFTWRKLWVILCGSVAVVIGAALLTALFPNYAGWLSVEWFLEAATSDRGYTSSGDLNRLNAISSINELWLTDWGERLFGLGLGNCDTSAFSLVNTPFYANNADMHYTWLSYAFMYMETGYLGLIFYFGFFVLVHFAIRKIQKHSEGLERRYCCLGRIVAICCLVLAVYNSSLRTEAGYMAYFVLAIPFVYRNRWTE